MREWLPEDHLAWFIQASVEEMDLSAFYAAYRADGHGRAAYQPSMMVAVLLYAYARGVRSSRAIERACEEDVAYRVLAGNQKPDHATLARFVERHDEALAGLFGEVLGLCAEAGLVRAQLIAIDGTKVAANASRDADRDYEVQPRVRPLPTTRQSRGALRMAPNHRHPQPAQAPPGRRRATLRRGAGRARRAPTP